MKTSIVLAFSLFGLVHCCQNAQDCVACINSAVMCKFAVYKNTTVACGKVHVRTPGLISVAFSVQQCPVLEKIRNGLAGNQFETTTGSLTRQYFGAPFLKLLSDPVTIKSTTPTVTTVPTTTPTRPTFSLPSSAQAVFTQNFVAVPTTSTVLPTFIITEPSVGHVALPSTSASVLIVKNTEQKASVPATDNSKYIVAAVGLATTPATTTTTSFPVAITLDWEYNTTAAELLSLNKSTRIENTILHDEPPCAIAFANSTIWERSSNIFSGCLHHFEPLIHKYLRVLCNIHKLARDVDSRLNLTFQESAFLSLNSARLYADLCQILVKNRACYKNHTITNNDINLGEKASSHFESRLFSGISTKVECTESKESNIERLARGICRAKQIGNKLEISQFSSFDYAAHLANPSNGNEAKCFALQHKRNLCK